MSNIKLQLRYVFALTFVVGVTLAFTSCGPTTTVARGTTSSVERELLKQQALAIKLHIERSIGMESLSWPIMLKNAELCETVFYSFGWDYATYFDYESAYRKAARIGLKLSATPKIIGIIKNSPSYLAGLRIGDQFVSIQGQAFQGGRQGTRNLEKLLDKWSQPGQLTRIEVLRAGESQTRIFYLRPQAVCGVPVTIVD